MIPQESGKRKAGCPSPSPSVRGVGDAVEHFFVTVGLAKILSGCPVKFDRDILLIIARVHYQDKLTVPILNVGRVRRRISKSRVTTAADVANRSPSVFALTSIGIAYDPINGRACANSADTSMRGAND